jgi:hypothetical protein
MPKKRKTSTASPTKLRAENKRLRAKLKTIRGTASVGKARRRKKSASAD